MPSVYESHAREVAAVITDATPQRRKIQRPRAGIGALRKRQLSQVVVWK
jgi:hypothetical protein